MSVYLCVFYVFLNDWTEFDDIFCVCLGGSWDVLDSQLDPVDPTRVGAQTAILIFEMNDGIYYF